MVHVTPGLRLAVMSRRKEARNAEVRCQERRNDAGGDLVRPGFAQ